jgi:hypothetical protein
VYEVVDAGQVDTVGVEHVEHAVGEALGGRRYFRDAYLAGCRVERD